MRAWPYIQDKRGRWYYVPVRFLARPSDFYRSNGLAIQNDPLYPLNDPHWPALDGRARPAPAAAVGNVPDGVDADHMERFALPGVAMEQPGRT